MHAKYSQLHFILILLIGLFLNACAVPRSQPMDLDQFRSPQELGEASWRAYQKARDQTEKSEKLKHAHHGIVYSEKCLKQEDKNSTCLYYNVLNRGIYIKNHTPNYQRALRNMVARCNTLLDTDPGFENGGCYRVLGGIYAKTPSFSLDPKSITRDLDKSVEYLKQAVQVAPKHALNHLLLARYLTQLEEFEEAQQYLTNFERLRTPELDRTYPEWKKEKAEIEADIKKQGR